MHVLEADRADEAGAEDGHHRPAGSSRWTSSSIVSNCAGAEQLDREPRAERVVGLDDRDVVGRQLAAGASTVATTDSTRAYLSLPTP